MRAEEAAHNGKWTLEAFRAIAAEVKHLTPSSVLQIDRILEEVGPWCCWWGEKEGSEQR